ncbi:MAG: hypothetical protein F2534_10955, partial [Actinobacteria bacterium]|nr:hypothetical protein [Actinomycetota bacterium]
MPATPNDDAPTAGRDAADRHRVVQHLLLSVTLLSLLATVLGLLLVQRVGTTYRDGLEVTA